MRLLYLITFLLFFSSSQSQQININICNEASNIAARNECIKGYIESLLYDQLKPKADSLQANIDVKAEIYLDAIGNFYIKSSEASIDKINNHLENVFQSIKPLDTYKNQKGDLLEDLITVDITLKPHSKKVSNGDSESDEIFYSENKANEDHPFATIEKVPVFPGCYESSNEGLKKCMSKNVNMHTNLNFNKQLAASLKLKPGIQRINVQFKINTQGYVVRVRSRASHPALEAEAIRVVKALPRMLPGKQKGKEVGVLYGLPIIFQVEGDLPKKRKKKRKNKN